MSAPSGSESEWKQNATVLGPLFWLLPLGDSDNALRASLAVHASSLHPLCRLAPVHSTAMCPCAGSLPFVQPDSISICNGACGAMHMHRCIGPILHEV